MTAAAQPTSSCSSVGGAYAAAVVGTRSGAGAPCSLPCTSMSKSERQAPWRLRRRLGWHFGTGSTQYFSCALLDAHQTFTAFAVIEGWTALAVTAPAAPAQRQCACWRPLLQGDRSAPPRAAAHSVQLQGKQTVFETVSKFIDVQNRPSVRLRLPPAAAVTAAAGQQPMLTHLLLGPGPPPQRRSLQCGAAAGLSAAAPAAPPAFSTSRFLLPRPPPSPAAPAPGWRSGG